MSRSIEISVNYGTAPLAIEAARNVPDRQHGGATVDVPLIDNATPGDDAAKIGAAHFEKDRG
jgi:hypothetical protein